MDENINGFNFNFSLYSQELRGNQYLKHLSWLYDDRNMNSLNVNFQWWCWCTEALFKNVIFQSHLDWIIRKSAVISTRISWNKNSRSTDLQCGWSAHRSGGRPSPASAVCRLTQLDAVARWSGACCAWLLLTTDSVLCRNSTLPARYSQI